MMKMYNTVNEEYKCLNIETPKREQLIEKVYSVCCFMKSQEKRCPLECDDKLHKIYWA